MGCQLLLSLFSYLFLPSRCGPLSLSLLGFIMQKVGNFLLKLAVMYSYVKKWHMEFLFCSFHDHDRHCHRHHYHHRLSVSLPRSSFPENEMVHALWAGAGAGSGTKGNEMRSVFSFQCHVIIGILLYRTMQSTHSEPNWEIIRLAVAPAQNSSNVN